MLAVVALLFCAAGVLTYAVGSKHLAKATSNLQKKQKLVDDSKKTAALLEGARCAYLKAESDLGCLEKSVSDYAYIPTLLGQLEQLGLSYKLKVVAIRPQPIAPDAPAPIKKTSEDGDSSEGTSGEKPKEKAADKKPYTEIQINVDLTGTYWCVHDFMQSLTRFPKIIAVKEIQMMPTEAGKMGSPSLNVHLVLTAFLFKDENSNTPATNGTLMPTTTKASIENRRSSNEG
jgi:Tfp pilus assembly protein PilO